MITSKEVLEQTGISRATLNNYIKMGILPKPLVRRPGTDLKGTKQIGYFPRAVLDSIKMVKHFKREGGTMEQIAKRFNESTPSPSPVVALESRRADEGPPIQPTESESSPIQPSESAASPTQERESAPPELPGDMPKTGLTLTIDEIPFPAVLVNHDFQIEWINPLAERHVFNNTVSKINELESRNLFKLFFSWEFNSHLKNWEKIVAYHLQFARNKFPKENLHELYQGISDSEVRFLEDVYENEGETSRESFQTSPLNFVLKDGTQKPYQIHSMFFREGIFFVYVPADEMINDITDMFAQRGKVINELLKHRMPSLVSLCVLVADLQDSVKISAELLPEEYFELINQLWKTMQSTFDKYEGIYGKQAGDGMLYYFIKKPGSNYVMDALNCALEIKEKMKVFNNEWKVRKGWLNDLYINTGINEGQEFFGTISSSSHLEFTALGDSINYAGRLSDIARYGSVWTTKNVISKMNAADMARVRFGVNRRHHDREIFVENSFARVIDLLEKDGKRSEKFMDIATLPITEVLASIPESTAAINS